MQKIIFTILLTILCSGKVLANDYPNRSIKWVVPYSAGGTADIIARTISQPLGEILGQQVIVDNRPGAGNNIGTEMVIKSSPDGYTMLFVNPANGINASLYKNLSFNFIQDITPVVGLIRTPNIMVVRNNLPVQTIEQFISYCKNNNVKINMASSGSGTSVHLAGELFKSMTGCNMVHVPYKGAAPALIDLIAGHVDVMFDNLPSAIAAIRANQVKALGITSTRRSDLLPNVPTISDTVVGYEVIAWYGIGMPKNTPNEIVQKINQAVNQVMKDPKVRERLSELGGISIAGSSTDFSKIIVNETNKWAPIVKTSGASID